MDEQMSREACVRCGQMHSNADSGLCMFCAQETLADTVRRIVRQYDRMQEHLERYVRALMQVPSHHLPSCPMEALLGIRIFEGDYCVRCPYRPDKLEYTCAECWDVWKAHQEAVDDGA